MGRAAIFFPVIGVVLGLVLVLANVLLEPFARPGLSSVALVAVLALLTRGLHLDGLGDTFDGLGAGVSPRENFTHTRSSGFSPSARALASSDHARLPGAICR